MRLAMLVLAASGVSGCVGTATRILTAPVRAAGAMVDLATTSRDEADRNRGRRLRERDEAIEHLSRRREREAARCADGNGHACVRLDDLDAEIPALRRQPV